VRRESENPKFTASDIKKAGGISYRQLNGWDTKGALPRQRARSSGWRKFDPKQFFVILVCAELRKQFGVPIEKLAWLQKFMLQDGADHFSAALEMMKYGLAVLIFTDLSHEFEMDADYAIGGAIDMGSCRYEKSQSHVLILVNPIINKMLLALKNPMRLEITEKIYDAVSDVRAAMTVRDTAELEVLKLMRQTNVSKISVMQTNEKEVVLEIDENAERDGTIRTDQIPLPDRESDHAAPISRRVVKKVAKEAIGLTAVKVN
jgi:DNA-binding transcriptional MerR regulator